MPIYSFQCSKCGFIREELRKTGDLTAPKCVYCKEEVMERVFEPVATIFKGTGWTNGSQVKIQKRSAEQGKKFFKRHPDMQDWSQKSVADKAALSK
jgi:putative FmdB family regulatory protein